MSAYERVATPDEFRAIQTGWSFDDFAKLEAMVEQNVGHAVQTHIGPDRKSFRLVPRSMFQWFFDGWRDDPLEAAYDYCRGWEKYIDVRLERK